MLKAITFDCWGTLYDGHHSLKSERADFLCLFLDCPTEQAMRAYDESWDAFGGVLAQGWGLPTAALLNDTLARLGVTLAPQDYALTLRFWQEHLLDFPPALLPGARRVLRELRARGYWIGLISDTGATPGRVLRQMLQREGMLHLFDWLTFSDEMGVTKSHPQAYLHTLRALGVRPSETLHVGDSPETDIRGAHAAGLHAALLLENSNRREGVPEADLVLERLRDLPAKLEAWLARGDGS
jgi:putative hydrolase of the HAD superfamily